MALESQSSNKPHCFVFGIRSSRAVEEEVSMESEVIMVEMKENT